MPVAMEFMDNDVLRCIKMLNKEVVPDDTDAMLLLQFDGDLDAVNAAVCKCEKIIKDTDVTYYEKGGDLKREEEIWEIRRLINPASHKMGDKKIAMDICVPRSKIPYIIKYSKKIGKEYDLPVLCFGHLGDGNIHVNIMYSKNNEDKAHELDKKNIKKRPLQLVAPFQGNMVLGF